MRDKPFVDRRALAKMWGIAPYRIDLVVDYDAYQVSVDGREPSEDQLATLKRTLLEGSKKSMN